MNIGFFDSGIGGFYMMERVMREMPEYNYVFYGDTKHLPYGNKKEQEIYQLTRNAIWYLFSAHNAELIVVACNTASAETLRRLQTDFLAERYPTRKILGVIIPTVETIIESKVEKPLLIGTTRTVSSGKFEKELAKAGATFVLKSKATPELVPLIEAGHMEKACDTIDELLKERIKNGGDSVILGCTHYSLLVPTLRARYGNTLRFFSQDEIIPGKLKNYLERHPEIESLLAKNSEREIIWSAEREPVKNV